MGNFSELREKTSLSIQQVAQLTGYSERTVYRWNSNASKPKNAVVELLSRIAEGDYPYYTGANREFSFIDLFAGIGGMRAAFESIGGKCVHTNEWNKYSRQTYLANFKCDHDISGDITKIHEKDIPSHDVLLAGFPCQPFSIAGVSKKNALGRPHGFACEIQGTLFFDIARIIKYHRPKAFLLENVKNLERHDKQKTFRTIREVLDGLGYKYSWKVLDARHWVPQHRERIFIVGFLQDCDFSFDQIVYSNKEKPHVLKDILHPADGSEEVEPPYTEWKRGRVSPKYTLSDHLWQYLREYAEKHRARGNGFGFGLAGPNDVSRTLSARYYKDGSEILIKQAKKNPRRLTPRECSRLMGFDCPGESKFTIPVSDTQAYKQFGNAVVVPVVKAVARAMHPYILGEVKAPRGQMSIRLAEKKESEELVYG